MDIPELKYHGFAKLIRTGLSETECNQLITKANERGWSDALINNGGKQILDKEIRFCKRSMFIDEELSDMILSKIKEHIPEEFGNRTFTGINPMLRFLKYGPGHYFKPHYDLRFADKEGSVSLITVQIYLNEDFSGGETPFYNDSDGKKIYSHVPKRGDIILFEQTFEHAGAEVEVGTKYSLRTELMYG